MSKWIMMGFFKRLFCFHYWIRIPYFVVDLSWKGYMVNWYCNKCGKVIRKPIHEQPLNYIGK